MCHSWYGGGLRTTFKACPWRAGLLLFSWAALVSGADVDTAKLPPPANGKVDFDHDIRPILEQSCLRCHGPEKPKSHFRLTSREAALKGGDNNTDDIVPGDSGHSRLIHYVAGLVPDLQMPPPGKAEPLTPDQIGRLRAWIDQGTAWSATNQFFPQSPFSISPMLRWVSVRGDSAKFREIEGMQAGWGGGIEQFSLEEQDTPDTKLALSGHFLGPDEDLQVKLLFTKRDVYFLRAGFESWRKYYDDSGGYYRSFSPPSYRLGQDLSLDTGRAWADFGLTLPKWPQLVLGYEYQFKDGAKSMLEWGTVIDKKIYPAAMNINEGTHIAKVDLAHDLSGWHLEDKARVEFYSNTTLDQQSALYTTGPVPDAIVNTANNSSHVQGANAFRFEKQLNDWWLFSGGYLYSHYNGNSSMNQTTTDPMNNPVNGTFWSDQVTLRREMQVASLTSMFLPLAGLSLSLGVQTEFSRQAGFGDISLDEGDPNVPGAFLLQPATVQSDLDETKIMEEAQLRYTRLPFTVLFAEGSFAQDSISQCEQEAGNTRDAFLRATDYFNNRLDCRVGFNTSPWRRVALNAQYRRTASDSDYNNLRDTNSFSPPGDGYSAFITHREIVTDEMQTKLVLRPLTWLKTTLTYRWVSSDFRTTSDAATDVPIFPAVTGPPVSPGGEILAGTYHANVYGINAVFVPSRRFYFSGTFNYSDSRTATWAQNIVPGIVVPYQGSIYSVIASGNYAVSARTRLQASYSFSQAGFGQNNFDGLPLGIDYTRNGLTVSLTHTFTKYLAANLRYRFYDYHEESSGTVHDYIAQGVFATLMVNWP